MIPIEKVVMLTETYPILALLILGFLGTEALLLIMFLAGSGYLNLSFWTIFIVGFLIVLVLDAVYYKVGNWDFIRNINPRKLTKGQRKAVQYQSLHQLQSK